MNIKRERFDFENNADISNVNVGERMKYCYLINTLRKKNNSFSNLIGHLILFIHCIRCQ